MEAILSINRSSKEEIPPETVSFILANLDWGVSYKTYFTFFFPKNCTNIKKPRLVVLQLNCECLKKRCRANQWDRPLYRTSLRERNIIYWSLLKTLIEFVVFTSRLSFYPGFALIKWKGRRALGGWSFSHQLSPANRVQNSSMTRKLWRVDPYVTASWCCMVATACSVTKIKKLFPHVNLNTYARVAKY